MQRRPSDACGAPRCPRCSCCTCLRFMLTSSGLTIDCLPSHVQQDCAGAHGWQQRGSQAAHPGAPCLGGAGTHPHMRRSGQHHATCAACMLSAMASFGWESDARCPPLLVPPLPQGSVANLLMMQCFAAAGMPPGLINCVTGAAGSGRDRGLVCHVLSIVACDVQCRRQAAPPAASCCAAWAPMQLTAIACQLQAAAARLATI